MISMDGLQRRENTGQELLKAGSALGDRRGSGGVIACGNSSGGGRRGAQGNEED